MDEARDILGSAGIHLVLALLKADRIPCPPRAMVASVPSELLRHDLDEPLYVVRSPRRPRPAAVPRLPASTSLTDEFKNIGLNVGPACAVGTEE